MFIWLVILTSLSILIFNCLFYWLNNSNLCPFNPIRNKIDTFTETKIRTIKIITFIALVIIGCILLALHTNTIIIALIIGILSSIRDICLKNNIIETLKK